MSSTVGVGVRLSSDWGGDDQTRCAIAALRRARIGKGLLQGVHIVAPAQPGAGRNVLVFRRPGQCQAGIERLAVDQHRAGATITLFATAFDVDESRVT